jgi:hypothetical protein
MESTTERILNEDKSLSDSDREFILRFKYNGKTAIEWENDLNTSNGYDENGIPEWYTPMSMMTDTLALARTMLIVKDSPLKK